VISREHLTELNLSHLPRQLIQFLLGLVGEFRIGRLLDEVERRLEVGDLLVDLPPEGDLLLQAGDFLLDAARLLRIVPKIALMGFFF